MSMRLLSEAVAVESSLDQLRTALTRMYVTLGDARIAAQHNVLADPERLRRVLDLQSDVERLRAIVYTEEADDFVASIVKQIAVLL